MINYGSRLLVNRNDFHDIKLEQNEPPTLSSLPDECVLLEIDKFAYTSNNATYALVGDRIGYWKFFPVPEEGYGLIPCWGFANVTHSKNRNITVGKRFYGFFPMASHLVISPGQISERGCTDMVAHRQGLPDIYNRYVDCSTDPLYKESQEEIQALIRPLFTTSFLIHDQLTINRFYDAEQIILISASSKTGLSLAKCLSAENVRVIGLTSDTNQKFVERTGYYDEVYSYDEIDRIDLNKSAIVDFAGNHTILLRLQNRLEDLIQHICLVGMVNYESHVDKRQLDIKPSFFFAPTYAAERIKELGHAEFGVRLAKKYKLFIKDAIRWIHIQPHKGLEALGNLHHKMIDGEISASDGHIHSF